MNLRRVGLMGGLAIALPFTIGVYQVWPRSRSHDWQTAESIAPSGLMEQVEGDNINPGFDAQIGNMKVLSLMEPGQTTPLYLIDTRTADSPEQRNPLCGALGCAFFGYVPMDEGYHEVLSFYLDPNLPPNVSLIEADTALQNGMPELSIYQMDGGQLLRLQLAFTSDRYEVVETQYLAAPQ